MSMYFEDGIRTIAPVPNFKAKCLSLSKFNANQPALLLPQKKNRIPFGFLRVYESRLIDLLFTVLIVDVISFHVQWWTNFEGMCSK